MGNATSWSSKQQNQKMGYWREIKLDKNKSLQIGGRNSAVATVGTNIYRFGSEDSELFYNDLFVFDASSKKFKLFSL